MKKLLIKMSDNGYKNLYANKDSLIEMTFAENKIVNLIIDAIATGEKELDIKVRKINNGKTSRKRAR